jgi:hypothetical protein
LKSRTGSGRRTDQPRPAARGSGTYRFEAREKAFPGTWQIVILARLDDVERIELPASVDVH